MHKQKVSSHSLSFQCCSTLCEEDPPKHSHVPGDFAAARSNPKHARAQQRRRLCDTYLLCACTGAIDCFHNSSPANQHVESYKAPVPNAGCAVPCHAVPLPPEELVSPSIMLSIIGFGSCIFAGHILAHYELEDCSNSICRSQNSPIVMDVLGERRVHG